MTEKFKWDMQRVSITVPRPNPNNPRTITKQEFEFLKNSISENGYTSKIICDKDFNVIGGHMRLLALKELGYTEIDVLIPQFKLSKKQKDMIALQDNIQRGDWDSDKVANFYDLHELQQIGFPFDCFPKGGAEFTGEDNGAAKQIECPACGHSFSPQKKKR